ncbi:MAG: hypothetical protein JSS65_14045 [Armatimonadetes bacterium]|nr:hypothetical protein [Armatimonadota bacterium]
MSETRPLGILGDAGAVRGRIWTRREALAVVASLAETRDFGSRAESRTHNFQFPQIILQPRSLSVVAGTTAYFGAVAAGDDLQYRWTRDGDPIPGAIADHLVLAHVTKAEEGAYRLVVTNSMGHVTSDAAQLEVDPLHMVATPVVEPGNFEVDDAMEKRNLIHGTLRPTVLDALPLELRIKVFALRGGTATQLPDACVEVAHCDAVGVRSGVEAGEGQKESTLGQTWLRGHQWTDPHGKATFKTIYPGWTPGRATHVSVRVRAYDEEADVTREVTTDLFFDDVTSDLVNSYPPYRVGHRVFNSEDCVYATQLANGDKAGGELTVHLDGSPNYGYTADFNFALVMA